MLYSRGRSGVGRIHSYDARHIQFSVVHPSAYASSASLAPTSGFLSQLSPLFFAKQKRNKGNASEAAKDQVAPSPYANTLNLPKTDFALRSDAKKLEESYKDAASTLYKWQVIIILCHELSA